jgi:hemoglobin-like flavoprotein
MALDIELLRSSFSLVADRAPALTARFYQIFFARYPQVRPMFQRNAPQKQQEMLQRALVAVLDNLEDASWLRETLGALGAKHLDYGVTEEMYGWVGECLLATLAEVAGSDWSPALAAAWTDAYGAVSGLMIAGAVRNRQNGTGAH